MHRSINYWEENWWREIGKGKTWLGKCVYIYTRDISRYMGLNRRKGEKLYLKKMSLSINLSSLSPYLYYNEGWCLV